MRPGKYENGNGEKHGCATQRLWHIRNPRKESSKKRTIDNNNRKDRLSIIPQAVLYISTFDDVLSGSYRQRFPDLG